MSEMNYDDMTLEELQAAAMAAYSDAANPSNDNTDLDADPAQEASNEDESDLDQSDSEEDKETKPDQEDVTLGEGDAGDDPEQLPTDSGTKPNKQPKEDTKKDLSVDNLSGKTSIELNEVRKYRADGKEFEFSISEILESFPSAFAKAQNYTRNMQKIAPWRKSIDALEQAGLGSDDVNLAIDVLKGSKEAISEVLKRNNVDVLDLNSEDSTYTPKEYGRSTKEIELAETLDKIKHDPEFVTTNSILAREWDDVSYNELANNPSMIQGLHADIKSGMYAKLEGQAARIKMMDSSLSDLQCYQLAGQQYFERIKADKIAEHAREKAARELEAQRIAEVSAAEELRKTRALEAQRKKSAATSSASLTGQRNLATDEFDEEQYIAWKNSVLR